MPKKLAASNRPMSTAIVSGSRTLIFMIHPLGAGTARSDYSPTAPEEQGPPAMSGLEQPAAGDPGHLGMHTISLGRSQALRPGEITGHQQGRTTATRPGDGHIVACGQVPRAGLVAHHPAGWETCAQAEVACQVGFDPALQLTT